MISPRKNFSYLSRRYAQQTQPIIELEAETNLLKTQNLFGKYADVWYYSIDRMVLHKRIDRNCSKRQGMITTVNYQINIILYYYV